MKVVAAGGEAAQKIQHLAMEKESPPGWTALFLFAVIALRPVIGESCSDFRSSTVTHVGISKDLHNNY